MQEPSMRGCKQRMRGRIHSLETFGTVDGPGVRFVVFFQGCPMRCAYCHNPDTWEMQGGQEMEADEILKRFERNRMFYKDGGITATGGEPLMQLPFLTDLFEKAKDANIHTCLDTSGIAFRTKEADEEHFLQIERLMDVTDLVMLDIKHTNEEAHRKLTGQSQENILKFARYLDEKKKPVWIRHVVVPDITMEEESLAKLGRFLSTLSNVEKLEILPYHAMGKVKYDSLQIPYRLKDTPQLTKKQAKEAEKIVLQNWHCARLDKN